MPLFSDVLRLAQAQNQGGDAGEQDQSNAGANVLAEALGHVHVLLHCHVDGTDAYCSANQSHTLKPTDTTTEQTRSLRPL